MARDDDALGGRPPPGRARSATTRFRAGVRDRTDPLERGDGAELTGPGVAWMGTQGDLVERFLYERAYDTVAEIVRSVLLQSRRVKRVRERLEMPPEQQREALQEWMERMEHCNKTYVRLGSMTKEELDLGAEEGRARTGHAATKWRWYTMLSAGMTAGQTVEQRYTALQVEQCYLSAQDEVNARLDDILTGVDEALDRIINPDDYDEQGNRKPRSPNGPPPADDNETEE